MDEIVSYVFTSTTWPIGHVDSWFSGPHAEYQGEMGAPRCSGSLVFYQFRDFGSWLNHMIAMGVFHPVHFYSLHDEIISHESLHIFHTDTFRHKHCTIYSISWGPIRLTFSSVSLPTALRVPLPTGPRAELLLFYMLPGLAEAQVTIAKESRFTSVHI